jgi:hypothetical protein
MKRPVSHPVPGAERRHRAPEMVEALRAEADRVEHLTGDTVVPAILRGHAKAMEETLLPPALRSVVLQPPIRLPGRDD